MKKFTFFAIATLIISVAAFSQIPNAGFENWTSHGAYSTPDGWGTMNNTTALASVYTASTYTPGNPGSKAIKLASTTVGPGVVNGIAVSGKLDSTTMMPKSGFAFNQQPQSLTGNWQHMIQGTTANQGSMSVTLTRWNTSTKMRETVAIGSVTLSGMAMGWASFSIPIAYQSSNLPDTCIIVMKASGPTATDGDYLLVDNLAFAGNVAIVPENTFITDLNLFPNPSSENINVEFSLVKKSDVKIQVADIKGRLVKEINIGTVEGASQFSFNTTGISKGNYLLNVITPEGIEVRKFILK